MPSWNQSALWNSVIVRSCCRTFGCEPVHIDAGTLTWCNRPRLYWTTWTLATGDGATVTSGVSPHSWELQASHAVDNYLEPGWTKVNVNQQSFPTFTTSRPSERPGRKPAGLAQCQEHEVSRWQADWHRFPPYQYLDRHGVVDKRGNIRVPSVAEREVMLGFPLHYTANCVSKGDRKKDTLHGCAAHLARQHMECTCRGVARESAPVSAGNRPEAIPAGHCGPMCPRSLRVRPGSFDPPTVAKGRNYRWQ